MSEAEQPRILAELEGRLTWPLIQIKVLRMGSRESLVKRRPDEPIVKYVNTMKID